MMTEQQRKLVEDNHNLIYSFLHRNHLSIEDYYDVAAIGLCKAAICFDSDKGYSFSTYAYSAMLSQVLIEKRKGTQAKTIPSDKVIYYESEIRNNDGDTSSFINFIPSKENIYDDAIANIIFEEYKSQLKDRDKMILDLIKNGYKQIEVAKIVGCSQTNVSRVTKKFSSYLYN